jgi:hypothetical protein
MANIYSVEQLSEHISETPEGYLLCESVPITRAGELIYAPDKTPITQGDGDTIITRRAEDITRPETMASFEGKPITILHPQDSRTKNFVTPENWKDVAVGVVQNVRPSKLENGADALIADLLITDAQAIERVKSKDLREVSCGYEAEFIEIAPGRGHHVNIIGNHVALVVSGRCGPECAIQDEAERKEPRMIEKLKMAMIKAFDQVIDSPDSSQDSYKGDSPVVEDQTPDQVALMGERLARLEEAVAQLKEMLAKSKETPEEEPKAEIEITADSCDDADTVARAEILSAGIAKTADVKKKALEACYSTTEGRTIIDTLLSGRAFDSVDTDTLFIATAEMVKSARREKLGLGLVKDSVDAPLSINEINARYYGKTR